MYMSKGIAGTVGAGIKVVYAVFVYSGLVVVGRHAVEACTVDSAIAMGIHDTIRACDDSLTSVVVHAHGEVVGRYDVTHHDMHTIVVNGHTYVVAYV